MRKLMVLLTVLATSLVAVGSVGANPPPPPQPWDVSLAAPAAIQLGGSFTLTGLVTHGGPVKHHDVYIEVYGGSTCTGDPLTTWGPVETADDGTYSYGNTWNDDKYTEVSFRAVTDGDHAENGHHNVQSECATMAIETPANWSITLGVAPEIVHTPAAVTWTGTLLHNGEPAASTDVDIRVYSGSVCEGDTLTTWPVTTDENGNFTYVEPNWVDDGFPAFSFIAVLHGNDAVRSDCVAMSVNTGVKPVIPTAVVPQVNSVFLCYSAFQVEPGVWPLSEAQKLYALGYWQPYAVPGNVEGGTNIGAYHLVCNLATGQSVGTGLVGGGGHVYGPGAVHDLGAYPIVQ